jgi:hypothetical protein
LLFVPKPPRSFFPRLAITRLDGGRVCVHGPRAPRPRASAGGNPARRQPPRARLRPDASWPRPPATIQRARGPEGISNRQNQCCITRRRMHSARPCRCYLVAHPAGNASRSRSSAPARAGAFPVQHWGSGFRGLPAFAIVFNNLDQGLPDPTPRRILRTALQKHVELTAASAPVAPRRDLPRHDAAAGAHTRTRG